MNDELLTPGVPTLSDEWIAQRTQHLIEEVSTPSPRRRHRRLLLGAGGGTVAAAVALVGLLGPWATPAFAGWSAQPTTPSTGQLSTAETACASLAVSLSNAPGATAPSTLPPLSLSDVRGPYSLLVYGGATSPALCVLGNGISVLHEDGATIGKSAAANKADGNTVVQQSSGSENFVTNPSATTLPAPGAAVVNIDNTAVSNGQTFSVVEGSVGSLVTGATLLLSDGSSVVATVSNGCFAAWWPSQATVSSIQVTTTAGVN